ncbi:tyrosine-type recombinase/integrase [Pseudoalteromonas nigrifaciens]|uniref:tyrosine-type recombinase/integrase n=1 Tax=Pseudoalteromonas nigrifaciens TaxID=28109 RepID=UPI0018686935|nr:site-specific integrase [Pseudoalteromonas nigrifaciens]
MSIAKTIKTVTTTVRFGEVNFINLEKKSLDMKVRKTAVIDGISGIRDTQLSQLVNIFIMEKASKAVDTRPISKALLHWVRWLEDKEINAFEPSILHYQSPSYGFREELLTRVNDEATELSYNTASNYINVIKNFYDFLDENNVVEKNKFYKSSLRISGRGVKANSTDLAIRPIKQHNHTPLNPLTKYECGELLKVIEQLSTQEYLIIMLMLGCGLRGKEVYTMNSKLFTSDMFAESESFIMRDITIGPKTGVKTKFSIPRELFVTKALYEEVLDYVESEEYKSKLAAYHKYTAEKSDYSPLFIVNPGKQANALKINNLWVKIKKCYSARTGKKLDHKPHDLRATFGTNLLRLLSEDISDMDQVLDLVKIAMGHKSVAQTMKYINHFTRESTLTKAANILDRAASRFYQGVILG